MANFVEVTFSTLEIVHPTSVRARTSMSKVFKFFDKLDIFFELGAIALRLTLKANSVIAHVKTD